MRWALALLVAVLAAAGCVDEVSAPSARTAQALQVYNGSTSSLRLGKSLAGCGPVMLSGTSAAPFVVPIRGPAVTLPAGQGFGNAVACDEDGAVIAASAITSRFVWLKDVLPDGGAVELQLDAGALTSPGLSLSVMRVGQGTLVAAGAPQHDCGGSGCSGGLQVWLSVPRVGTVTELGNLVGTAYEQLGGSVAIGPSDGGFLVAVTALGSPGPAMFDITSRQLVRSDAGFVGLTSVAAGTFAVGRTFVVGQPSLSRAIILDPGGATPFAAAAQVVQCATNSGLGAVVAAYDWDGDGLSDVVLSNPAMNRVEVAFSAHGYICEPLPVPTLPPGGAVAGFGQSLAFGGTSVVELAVGAPLTAANLLPASGLVALYTLCDLPSMASRCSDAGTIDAGGAIDAGLGDAGSEVDAGLVDVDAGLPPRDGGPDSGDDSDAGFDGGPLTDAGTDAGVDAGAFTDAGLVGDGGLALDAGAPDAGAPDAGAPDAGAPDAGAPDAGAPDAGAGLARLVPVSCGCTTGSPPLFAFALAVLVRRRRRR